MADLLVHGGGSVYPLRPTSRQGSAWVDQHISPDATWFGGADRPGSGGMTGSLPLSLTELEHSAAVLWLSLQGLRAAWASNAIAQGDFDVVCHSAEKLRAHLQGVRIEWEYARGGN